MTWKIKELNKNFIVSKQGQGSFTFNNKKDAERLCSKLNEMYSRADWLIHEGNMLVDLGKALKGDGGVDE